MSDPGKRARPVRAFDHQYVVFDNERITLIEQVQRLAGITYDHANRRAVNHTALADRVNVDPGCVKLIKRRARMHADYLGTLRPFRDAHNYTGVGLTKNANFSERVVAHR
ncbi:MAG: hypothetical protein NZ739_11790 [Verrucomicrobiae bacterium]|nr:hypothetical protein [Verrucomicrobiae bacterium]